MIDNNVKLINVIVFFRIESIEKLAQYKFSKLKKR